MDVRSILHQSLLHNPARWIRKGTEYDSIPSGHPSQVGPYVALWPLQEGEMVLCEEMVVRKWDEVPVVERAW